MEAFYARCNLIPLYTPSGCTDCSSSVDHVGRFIQNAMSKAYQQEILTNPEVWFAANADEELDNPECKSAVARRILMARWTDLTTNHKHLIDSAFV